MTVRVAVPTADRSVAATAGPVAAASGAMGSLSRSAAVTVAVVAVSVGRFGRRKWGLLRRGHRPIIARTRGAHCSPRPL
ncbi:hypothetical protein [Streptomyces liliiviolaceus]|uniref:hypothetical protein n=1 Tax=Streptomyces liliiviolaceus TaxID=2823109 RepID=UPI001FFDAC41|nr:hypothetical protein [Streptomyces liliiviolaceus]